MNNSYGNSNSSINFCPVCAVEDKAVPLQPSNGNYAKCARCGLHFTTVELAMDFNNIDIFLETLSSKLPGFIDLWSKVEPVVRKAILLSAAQGER